MKNDDTFRIYVDRLNDGDQETIDLTVAPSFIDVQESDLVFDAPVHVEGDAYLSDSAVIVHLQKIESRAKVPCSVCNEQTEVSIELEDIYITEELDQVRGGIFDYKEMLREEILLAIPLKVECSEGSCPERETLAHYLEKKREEVDENTTYHPFTDL